ncbi:predicted protein [Naegleria gruberi]|uniref:Predicted protein n=1 Tax=Naegleria gruberi TaxID=5762 RepID=D2VXA1_NAEGR|nr:uncharacterized protein NAEGRDRAFT_59485 [Naegleria gruberi]EFC38641.1 predicted protein [Naegleria gruberi]|eukprot:XP_002671385.1 predicted protein [Naegleria gruberi strain NEG-M]
MRGANFKTVTALLLVSLVLLVIFSSNQVESRRGGKIGQVLRRIIGKRATKISASQPIVETSIQKCKSEGDPHLTTFGGVYYDHYGKGDYILASTEDGNFIAHSRTGQWGRVSVNTAIAVRVNNMNTIEYNVEDDKFYLDGKEMNIGVGEKVTLGGEASATRNSATQLTVVAKNQASLIATWYRNPGWKQSMGSFGHISLVVEAPRTVKFTEGMCVNKNDVNKSANGLLHDHISRQIVRSKKPKKATPEQLEKAKETCKKVGIHKSVHARAYKACVTDQIQSGTKIGETIAKVIKKVEKAADKKQKKLEKKIKKKQVFVKCKSEGDPHYVDFRGRAYDFYGKGDYVLAATKDGKFVAHSRTGRWGAVSVNTAVAVKLNNDRIVEYNVEDDKFYVDGKEAVVEVGKVNDLGNGASFKRVSQTSMIVSLNDVHLTATWYRAPSWKQSMGSFGHISLIVDSPKDVEFESGLCVSKAFIEKSATGVLHDHINRQIERNTKPKKATKKAVKKATKTCKKAGISARLHPLAFRACVADQVQTGDKIGKKIAKVIAKLEKLHDKKTKKWTKKIKKAEKKAKKAAKKAQKKQKKQKKQKPTGDQASRRAIRIARRRARQAKRAARLRRRNAERAARRARREAKRRLVRQRRIARKAARLARRAAKKNSQKKQQKKRVVKKSQKKSIKRSERKQKRRVRKAKKALKRSQQKKRRAAIKKAKKAAKQAKKAVLKKKRAAIKKQKRFIRKLRRIARRLKKQARKARKLVKKLLRRAEKTGKKSDIRAYKLAKKNARRARRAAKRACNRVNKKAKKINKLVKKAKKSANKAAKKAQKKTLKRALKPTPRRLTIAIKRASAVVVKKKTVKRIKRMLRRVLRLKRRLGRKFDPKKHLPKRILKLVRKLKLAGKCPIRNKDTVTTLGKKVVKQLVSVSKCKI